MKAAAIFAAAILAACTRDPPAPMPSFHPEFSQQPPPAMKAAAAPADCRRAIAALETLEEQFALPRDSGQGMTFHQARQMVREALKDPAGESQEPQP